MTFQGVLQEQLPTLKAKARCVDTQLVVNVGAEFRLCVRTRQTFN